MQRRACALTALLSALVSCGGSVTNLGPDVDATADARVDASKDAAFDSKPDVDAADVAEADGKAGCTSSSACPSGTACDVATGACTKKCSPTQPCSDGCCDQHGMCVDGLSSAACGYGGTACFACVAPDAAGCSLYGDGGSCGCVKPSECPAAMACDLTEGVCTTECSEAQPCSGTCCNGGTCSLGDSSTSCGPPGGLCLDCTKSTAGSVCVASFCGCEKPADCTPTLEAPWQACDRTTDTCSTTCSSTNICNGGCCSAAVSGTCVNGMASTACGLGDVCTDCTVGCTSGDTCACNASGQCTTTATFSLTYAPQNFTVPAGVTAVTIVAVGSSGLPTITPMNCQGEGGTTTATISVTPGETLVVFVGGTGEVPSFNGGGSGPEGGFGGDASDVRQGGSALGNRVVVAGGGGGCGTLNNGGAGGGLVGGPGISDSTCPGSGGGPGTQTSGGAGGKGSYAPGAAGSLLFGGNGPIGDNPGGGGGGYYGGGSGGTCMGGGSGSGGGGSSYAIPSATGVKMVQGGNDATGMVTITWVTP